MITNNKIKNAIFFTGEAATGKTFITHQLSRYLSTNYHLKSFVLHLGDRVRQDLKKSKEPALSMKAKIDNKILLNKEEINILISHYLKEMPVDTECLIVEGFPRTVDDVDLMMNELKDKFYKDTKISLASLSYEDKEASISGMEKRQKIPEKVPLE